MSFSLFYFMTLKPLQIEKMRREKEDLELTLEMFKEEHYDDRWVEIIMLLSIKSNIFKC